MNHRLANSWLCSLAVHAVLIAALFQVRYETGFAHDLRRSTQPLSVAIIRADQVPHPLSAQASELDRPLAEPTGPVDAVSSDSVADNASVSQVLPKQTLEPYFSVGQLTRQPAPIDDIDLNLEEIAKLGFFGKAELTLFIDAKGTVVEAIAENERSVDRDFVELVVGRFQQARFTPGEIDSVAVNSRLRVTVVSEAELDFAIRK